MRALFFACLALLAAPALAHDEGRVQVEDYGLDPYEAIITSQGVNQRGGPAMSNLLVNQLTHALMVAPWNGQDPVDGGSGPTWIQVERPDGSSPGWVGSPYWRSLVDYRYCFEMAKDDWVGDLFVAGY